MKNMFASIVVFKKVGDFDAVLTYGVPAELLAEVKPGALVKIPFRSRDKLGLVLQLSATIPTGLDPAKIKPLTEVHPAYSFSESTVTLARRIATYYQASLPRVLRFFVPKRLWESRLPKKPLDFDRVDPALFPLAPLHKTLTASQQVALDKIRSSLKPVLLQGVTGSGKTEIYLHLILEAVTQGKQALFLVPEIALTPQMEAYVKAAFGDHVVLLHSRMTDKERFISWKKIHDGAAPLVVGSRSALFAPFTNLGIIVVDEEHEWTYKQESAPYYHAHWVAEQMAALYGARLVFGSATPSAERYHDAQTGAFTHVELLERVTGDPMPVISVVDMREEFKKRHFGILSDVLERKVRERLAAGEQVILFVNQRGLARAVVCRDCGHTETCEHCAISLKLHRAGANGGELRCHYCSYKKVSPLVCPACQSPFIRDVGIGTQKVEEEIRRLFPAARAVRADADTTRMGEGFEPIYKAFLNRDYDVLIGTQMVAKGLDFHGVTLIGVVLADVGLHIPDFRSSERLFQILTQVAGRCGRGPQLGEVILQTYNPDHPAITLAAKYAYADFMREEFALRQKCGYPPFGRMVKITAVGQKPDELEKVVHREQESLEDILKLNDTAAEVLSAPALIAKIANQYSYHLIIRSADPQKVFDKWTPPPGWRVDIDPMHMG